MAKQIRVSFRCSEAFKRRLAAVAKTVSLDESVIGEAAIEAVIRHVEETGQITLPVALVKNESGEKMDARGSRSIASSGLNEEPPLPRRVEMKAPAPRLTSTRGALRKMQQGENPK